ncbi:claudin family member sinuous [Lycorma delicatula]|uniref:claudin family member sinuous n=1 Tax=Lycorma delicatula TaxID=130591 RepID=UPI003F50DFC1
MKRRSLAGNFGVGVFVLSLISIVIAFFSASWLVSDYRITGAKLDRLGLWTHCFRSLPDPQDEYQRRFFVGCRWIFDPFTTGYDQIRGYLMPWYIVITQFFFTLAFLGVLASFILVLLFALCFGPHQKRFVKLVQLIGGIMLGVGLSGGLAVIVFALTANRDNWMPGHDNNFFGWSFALAVAGVIEALICSALFLLEANIQKKKQKQLKESQTRFEMEQEAKA